MSTIALFLNVRVRYAQPTLFYRKRTDRADWYADYWWVKRISLPTLQYFIIIFYYAAFNAPYVGHKDDESQAS